MTVKVGELLETLDGRLALELVAGVTGLDRPIDVPRVQQPGLALAGYLPQLHPDRMQVLGNSEVGYLETLDPALARERIEAVIQSGVASPSSTNGTPPPRDRRGGGPLRRRALVSGFARPTSSAR